MRVTLTTANNEVLMFRYKKELCCAKRAKTEKACGDRLVGYISPRRCLRVQFCLL